MVVVYPVAGTGCGGWVSGPPEAISVCGWCYATPAVVGVSLSDDSVEPLSAGGAEGCSDPGPYSDPEGLPSVFPASVWAVVSWCDDRSTEAPTAKTIADKTSRAASSHLGRSDGCVITPPWI